MLTVFRRLFAMAIAAALSATAFASWTTSKVDNGIQIERAGKPVARFVFGEAELKPYLHVHGPNGELLTEWKADQQFPHHRGIFIGWNKIQSDLGSDDLWHLRSGETFKVRGHTIRTSDTNATLHATIEWRSAKKDAENPLIVEERTLDISQRPDGTAQIDTRFTLRAERDLKLDGDLQHAGIHFRGSHELTKREKETKYLWEPPLDGPGGKVVSTNLKWCRLVFSIGEKSFAATQLNAPSNPVEELSWRAYGRFGFFFKKQLKRGESFTVNYRFLVGPHDGVSEEQQRQKIAEEYKKYAAAARYEVRSRHDPNGIGKFYLGREIAHVMGHQGADWLDRDEREREEAPDKMVELLGLKPGDHVADIGAGTGYITWRMAKKVGPSGKVYAVEIQQEMLDLLVPRMKQRGLDNVVPVLGGESDPKLPAESIDLAIMVDVYHELSEPAEMMENLLRALKPGGRIAFIEYRAEDPNVPIKAVHKMTEAQIRKEAAAAGLEWVQTISDLPWQHLVIARKPLSP